jgi:hypothetical protein
LSPGAVPTSANRQGPGFAQAWRLVRLRPRDWALVAWAGVLFVFAEIGLRCFNVADFARRTGVPIALDDAVAVYPSDAPWLSLSPVERHRIEIVNALSRRTYGTDRGCLRRALVLGWLLRGRHPYLRIGVARDEVGVVRAHAWLEVAGVRLERDIGYQPFVA